MYRDSLQKVIGVYVATIASEPFTWGQLRIEPRPLQVSPLLFRGYTCPPGCGGCCPRFSLVYLPEPLEKHPYPLTFKHTVIINGQEKVLYEDPQPGDDHFCQNLNRENGRCGIYHARPFSCDFELTRFMVSKDISRPNHLMTRLFGRGWSFLRVDGERGAKCEILAEIPEHKEDVIRKLKRLKAWTDYLGVKTYIDDIIAWSDFGHHNKPLMLWPTGRGLMKLRATRT